MSRPQYEYKWAARTDSFLVGVLADGEVEITCIQGNTKAPMDVIRELVQRMDKMHKTPAIAITFNEELDPTLIQAVGSFLNKLATKDNAIVELIHNKPDRTFHEQTGMGGAAHHWEKEQTERGMGS